MHAHDRTLIARMGFDDPDKKDRRHDLACQYLVANKERFLRRVFGEDCGDDVRGYTLEKVISKGSGQYRTTIGFVDLVIHFRRPVEYDDGQEGRESRVCCIEVKVKPLSVGDIIRQVKLYREYRDSTDEWVVVTAFPLQEPDVLALGQCRIRHVLLGEGFEKWVAEQDAKSGGHDLSIEF